MTRKCLHIITGLGTGGAEAVLYNLIQASDWQHEVISLMDEGKFGLLLRAEGVAVHTLGMKRGRVTLRGIVRLWRIARAAGPDVVQTWMYHSDLVGGMVARAAGIRAICWGLHHSDLSPETSRRSTHLVARLCARLSRVIPRRIVCCAQRARHVHADIGYDKKRMVVIPNGYDLGRFNEDAQAGREIRSELGIAPDAAVIGFVARYNPDKDHETLLQALALLPPAIQCVLAGPDMTMETPELAGKIAQAGVSGRLHLLGPRDDVPAVMSAMNLHVMSSRSEGFPNVLCEAMACGTPCVSTDVGDAREIIGETGWIVPPSEPHALADAIKTALAACESQGNWADRREAARHRVERKYSLDRMVSSYHQVWQAAIVG